MKIAGCVRFSLCDFPGRTSAVVFTQGCNFQCPFCHNQALIAEDPVDGDLLSEDDFLEFLSGRKGQLDGVVVSGGEPTVHADLPEFLRRVKSMGFDVKLDTNGSRPEVLDRILADSLVDFVAMDVKAPLASYEKLSGIPVPVEKLERSMMTIARSGVEHEFRTTLIDALISEADVETIRQDLPKGSPHRCQPFRPPV